MSVNGHRLIQGRFFIWQFIWRIKFYNFQESNSINFWDSLISTKWDDFIAKMAMYAIRFFGSHGIDDFGQINFWPKTCPPRENVTLTNRLRNPIFLIELLFTFSKVCGIAILLSFFFEICYWVTEISFGLRWRTF